MDCVLQLGEVAMAGATGDIIQITLNNQRLTNTYLNVFYYRCLDAPTATYLTGILSEFQAQIMPSIMALYPSTMVPLFIQALNIFSGDILEDNTPTPAAGTRAGITLPTPPFMAAMILLTRQNNRVRHGRKFFWAPDEVDIADNTFAGTFITLMGNLAAVLDNNLFPGGTDEFQPVIVGRVEYVTPQGKTAYRLPESQAEMDENWSPVGEPRFVNRPTTMNSRKYGRGI